MMKYARLESNPCATTFLVPPRWQERIILYASVAINAMKLRRGGGCNVDADAAAGNTDKREG